MGLKLSLKDRPQTYKVGDIIKIDDCHFYYDHDSLVVVDEYLVREAQMLNDMLKELNECISHHKKEDEYLKIISKYNVLKEKL